MKRLAIIQARMSSSRLPGKVLAQLAGLTVINRVFKQLSYSRMLTGAILATSCESSDDPLEGWANDSGIAIYRGSLDNVLSRYIEAAEQVGHLDADDVVVRITADCPLIEPTIVDQVLEQFESQSADYCSNIDPRTFPDGYDVEAVRLSSLIKASSSTKLVSDLEHVTPFIRRNPPLFKHAHVTSSVDRSHWRLTLDTKKDLVNIEMLVRSIEPKDGYISMVDVDNALNQNNELIDRIVKENDGELSSEC